MGPEKAQIGRLSQTAWAKGFSPQPWHWLGLAQLETLHSVYCARYKFIFKYANSSLAK